MGLQERMTIHMYRGRMRQFRIGLMNAVSFSERVCPFLAGKIEEPYAGKFTIDARVSMLWQNATKGDDTRQDHNVLSKMLGLSSPEPSSAAA